VARKRTEAWTRGPDISWPWGRPSGEVLSRGEGKEERERAVECDRTIVTLSNSLLHNETGEKGT
jgi:hypothetical protein